jgi:hypothetical protein
VNYLCDSSYRQLPCGPDGKITVFTTITLGSRLTMICLLSGINNTCSCFVGFTSLISLDSDNESDDDKMNKEPLTNFPSNKVKSDFVVVSETGRQ